MLLSTNCVKHVRTLEEFRPTALMVALAGAMGVLGAAGPAAAQQSFNTWALVCSASSSGNQVGCSNNNLSGAAPQPLTANFTPSNTFAQGGAFVQNLAGIEYAVPNASSNAALSATLTGTTQADGLQVSSGTQAITLTPGTASINDYVFGIYAAQIGYDESSGTSTGAPVTINNGSAINMALSGLQALGGAAIWAADQAGNATVPSNAGGGGPGGNSAGAQVFNTGAINATLAGSEGFAGIQVRSSGGNAQGWGSGGSAGAVQVTSNEALNIYWTWQGAGSSNSGVYGIQTLSEGGSGGNYTEGNAGYGGGGAASSITLNSGSVSLNTYGTAPTSNSWIPSGGLVAASTGGAGGSASSGNANDAGGGASAGLTSITMTDGNVNTLGANLPGILAYGVGGAGGNGGTDDSENGPANPSQNGMYGGGTNGATITVSAQYHPTSISTLAYSGDSSPAIAAIQLGGLGGWGGYSFDSAASVSHGGNGAYGGDAGPINIQLQGQNGNRVTVNTNAVKSPGIYAYGKGGDGNYGGASDTAAAGNSHAGNGGSGGSGSDINVSLVQTSITTQHSDSPGIVARSVGGAGANGGYADGTKGFGGNGGNGGDSGNITVQLDSGSSISTTYGSGSIGILAQTLSAAGGNSGGYNGSSGGNGGTSSPGGNAGTISVTNGGTISTAGPLSQGIFAQTMAGAGGSGGSAWSVFHSSASSGAEAGSLGAITVVNNGAITTAGSSSQGVLLQSIGGGGGVGGSASGLSVVVGGSGGNATAGGNINFTNAGSILTTATGGIGVLGQSIGGDGGDGGSATGATLTVGGSGGDSSTTGGTIVANLNSGSSIATVGDYAHGAVFQAIGGGGGNGGSAQSDGISISMAVGGSGGAAGGGGTVSVNTNGAKIITAGTKSVGLVAQSIGGGGGTGGGAQSTSIGPVLDLAVAVGGSGGSGSNGGGLAEVAMIGGSIATGQSSSLINGSAGSTSFCPGTSSGSCNVQPVDSHGVVVQSIGGGGGLGGGATAQSIAVAAPTGSSGDQFSISLSQSTGGAGGAGGNGGAALFGMSSGATITTAGSGATGVLAQSIGGGGGDGGDSSAMAASVGYGSADGESTGVQVSATAGGSGGGAGEGGAVQIAIGGTTGTDGSFSADAAGSAPTSIVTYGDYAAGIKAQSIGGGGGNAGTGSNNTQDFGTKTTTSYALNVGALGSGGGNGGDTTVYLYQGNGIQTWGSSAVGVMAQSIGGGGGSSQGGSLAVASTNGAGSQKFGGAVSLGLQTGAQGGDGKSVLVSVAAPIVTHGNDSTGVVAQSIGGGGGVGGASGSDSSGDNPVLQAMQGREFISDVTNYLNDQSTPTQTGTLSLMVGGKGGAGGNGGDVTVFLASQISTLGNPVVAGGNQQASSGDWAHGIVAQSVGGGGGKGGTAISSSQGGDWAEINSSFNLALGGSGGEGGSGGTTTVNLQDGGVVLTKGFGATGVVAQSIGGGGGLGADGSDALGGVIAIGGGAGGTGGSGGSGGAVYIQQDGNLGSLVQTSGTFADGIHAQSIGGGGGIGGAGASIWGELLAPQVSKSLTLTAGGGSAASGAGGNVYVNQNFQNYPLYVNVSGYGSYGILAQSVGGGGGTIIANQTSSSAPTIALGGLSIEPTEYGGDILVQLTSGSKIVSSGTAGVGVLAQSVGGGGGIIRVNDGQNTTPVLTTAFNQAFVNQYDIKGFANGGNINVTSYADINADGPGGIGILAQSVGGGGGLILNGSTLYAGAPMQQNPDVNCTQVQCGGVSAQGSQNFVVTLEGGTVSAAGANGIGIFAQAAGYGPVVDGTPNIVIGSGDNSNGHVTTVIGGSGTGAGVWVDRPSGASNYNQAFVKTQVDGVINTASGSGGTAINVTGGGSVIFTNLGSFTGSIALGPQSNETGASTFALRGGVNDGSRGFLMNSGTWTAGQLAIADILNEGNIRHDNAAMTTRVNGDYVQTKNGRYSPLIDSLNGSASMLYVEGRASVDGLITPQAVSLLPGTVSVLTAGDLGTTAQVQDSLVFDWDARTSGKTITVTPNASFKPTGVALNKSQSALGGYYDRAWKNADPALARQFAGFSGINGAGEYKQTLDNLSSKALHAQSMAVIESAGSILGAGMSCPIFIGDGVKLGQDSCAWGQISGRWTHQSATSSIQGYSVSGTTYRLGGQHRIAPSWFLGGSVAAGKSYARVRGGSSGSGDTYDGTITLKHERGPWQFAGSIAAATGSFDNMRHVQAFGESTSLKSDSNIFLLGARFRTSYEFDQGDWYIRPYGDVDVVRSHAPGFKESAGSSYALDVRTANQTNVSFSPMIEFGRRSNIDEKTSLRAYAAVGLSWRPDNTRTIKSSFVGADARTGTFNDYIKSPEVLGKIDLGLQLFRNNRFEVRAGYTADIGNSFLSQTATARFAYHF